MMRSPSDTPHSVEDADAVGRPLAVLVALMLVLSVLPAFLVVSAQTEAQGYLVFRGSQPIGPDLDVSFHVVVPDDVEVLGARLDLYGTRGIMPVASETLEAGDHNHSLLEAGEHSHDVEASTGHIHNVPDSGEHDHPVYVMYSVIPINDARMTADLPSHDHTFDGTTRVVDPYTFPTVTSNGHNHTASVHGHETIILASGDHNHTTYVDGAHDHNVSVAGGHVHDSTLDGEHANDLAPGWSVVENGTRPEGVTVVLSTDLASETLPGSHGVNETDWHETVDLEGRIAPGITGVTLTSITSGQLEYVLLVEVDASYGVITGISPLGGNSEGDLVIPIRGPPGTLSVQAYLFGDDLPMVTNGTDLAGEHFHDALISEHHAHTVDAATDHAHNATGGAHTHEGNTTTVAPPTDEVTPYWILPTHRHDVSWAGNIVTDLSSYGYGRVQSTDHNHFAQSHDHVVNLNISGNHSHDLTWEDIHVHGSEVGGGHAHEVTTSTGHAHQLGYDPVTSGTGGPTDVRATWDGEPLTSGVGPRFNLTDTPVVLDPVVADWNVPHFLNLTAATAGEVEWVVVLELNRPLLIASMNGLAGDVVAHMPTPPTVAGALVGVMGDAYVMPLASGTAQAGAHVHTTTQAGNHSHATTVDGAHTHELLDGTGHLHELYLFDTVVNVSEANGSVTLPSHTHTISLGAFMTSPSAVGGATGTHSHETDPHDHSFLWNSSGTHNHTVVPAGNHSHEMIINGSHGHTMSGGPHQHDVLPGVTYDAAWSNLAQVDVGLGTGPDHHVDGGAPGWWEEWNVPGEQVEADGMTNLSVSAGTLGTVSAVVWFTMDFEPPAATLLEAPDWVMPGQVFTVIIGLIEDTDPASISLDIGPVDVTGLTWDGEAFTATFDCEAPAGATEGIYGINVTAGDFLGNEATTTVGTLGIDGTPPTVWAEVDEPRVEGDGLLWVTSGTPVTMGIEDGMSGPSVLEYAFSADGPWTEYDPLDQRVLEGQLDGPLELVFRGSDVAGNVAPAQSIDLIVDDTPPEVTLGIHPYAEGATPDKVSASPRSLIDFALGDGDGVGAEEVTYRIVQGTSAGPWRTFDRPFPVSDVTSTPGAQFTIEWNAADLLGNTPAAPGKMEVTVDATSPVAHPGNDMLLPHYTGTNPYTVRGQIPGGVARLHYRTDTGSAGTVDIQPNTPFSFPITLAPGPNVLIYALEDPLGNTSPWVVAGTIVMDNNPPEVHGSSPANEGTGLPTRGTVMVVQFTEPVTNLSVVSRSKGMILTTQTETGPDGMSATISFNEDLPANSYVDVSMTFQDKAGNAGSGLVRFRTAGAAEESAYGYLWGLLAGLIIGAILVYFITFRRRDDGGPYHTGTDLQVGDGILIPEQHLGWSPEREEETGDEEEPDEEPEEEQYRDGDEGYGDDEEEYGEEIGEEGEEEEPEPPEKTDAEELDELSSEIDRLLEETTETVDLPDSGDETVDPGSRF